MIALDTNLLIRFLTQDDAKQAALAGAAVESLTADAPGFVSREVLVELVWVLERAYRYRRADIVRALEGLLSAVELVVEESDDVGSALDLYLDRGFVFADLMIAAAARRVGADTLLTFDRRAAGLDGVTLLGS
jgi:predicted nucleic-acid-binding protein